MGILPGTDVNWPKREYTGTGLALTYPTFVVRVYPRSFFNATPYYVCTWHKPHHTSYFMDVPSLITHIDVNRNKANRTTDFVK